MVEYGLFGQDRQSKAIGTRCREDRARPKSQLTKGYNE